MVIGTHLHRRLSLWLRMAGGPNYCWSKFLWGNVGTRDLCCWARYLNNVFKRSQGGQNQRDALGCLYSQHANPDTWRQRAPPIPFYTTQKICFYFRKNTQKTIGQHHIWALSAAARRNIPAYIWKHLAATGTIW